MSFSINRVTLLGNLSRDPELRQTKTGKSVLTLNLVTNYSMKQQDGTYKDFPTFHKVIVWGKIAEWLSKNLQKGNKVYVDGRINTSEYTDKEGKVQRSREIIAENCIPMQGEAKKPTVAPKLPTIEEVTEGMPTNPQTVTGNDLSSEQQKDEEKEAINPEDIPF